MLHTIMGCLAVAILALIGLAFFGVCLIVWNIYLRNQEVYEEEDNQEAIEHDVEMYKNGLGRAAYLMHVSLYKMWKDNGESVIVGTFLDIQKELSTNMGLILSNEKEDVKWEKMYGDYIETVKKSMDNSFDSEQDSESE